MEQEERNRRKQKWMAHGYGISKRFELNSFIIKTILDNVSKGDVDEFEAFVAILAEVETILHECGIAQFTEKYMLFQLADAELKK